MSMPKVLFLEDEVILAEDLPVLLKKAELDVVSTASIAEAWDWFNKEEFDVILLDIMMPLADDMDAEQLGYGRETGVEVARRMKECKPDVPLVAFTVLRDSAILKRMREAGIVEVITKPAEVDQITEVLWRVIRGSSEQR
jgi:CheY-like chemotaxis protein